MIYLTLKYWWFVLICLFFLVLLQPMREDPPIGTKCRDKFLVQTVSITPERENATVAELVS